MKRFLGIALILLITMFVFTGCAFPTLFVGSTPTASPTGASPVDTAPAPISGTLTTPAATQVSPLVNGTLVGSVAGLEDLLQSIYDLVNPSVVNIQVLKEVQTPTFIFPDLFEDPESPRYSSALGSGFIWDTGGDIVTNNHVVSGADRITVTFHDGTVVSASLVGADPDSDLAVIKLGGLPFPLQPVTLADSTQLRVGQLAVAIGNPFGLQGTMTVGFVSSLGRVIPADENNTLGPTYSIPDIVQTDASINPGNSGGVLLDAEGRVIGVTQSIATNSGTSSGVGFAIPSAIVAQVVPSLIQNGHYDHPYIGVTVVSMSPDLAVAMSLPANQRGALIVGLTAAGPAEKAGLRAGQNEVTINSQTVVVGGDVIIAYDGLAIKSSDDLITLLARTGSIGQIATFTVLRGGQTVQVPVTLEKRPSS